ncbi:MAG TPA: trypsin-like peptidase domain-containing protein [Phycisphaerales bacterium]|nr:trypsin-like peptidase domain-containing protein [Phycisphaerales bacterium]
MRRAILAAAVGAGVMWGGAGAAQDAAPPAIAEYPDFRQIVQEAKEKVFPAVVYIRVVSESTESGKRVLQESSGSGVIITPEGHILTNWHVVEKAQRVRCLLSDGRHAPATILGSDKDTDLAVIRLDLDTAEEVPHARLGDSTMLREGDFVMAMGAPWGLDRSVSIGIVSSTARYLEGVSEYSLWIQTDAAINPGNSGGPLVNTAGEVVGINTRGAAQVADGLGFSIPAATIEILWPRLRDEGQVTWSWTGLRLQALSDFNKDIYFPYTEGVIVAETDLDSPAREAGIRARDRIVRINGGSVTAERENDLPRVRRMLGLLPKGEEAALELVRGEETIEVRITPREKGRVEGEELALKRWDFTVKAINQFDNPDLYFFKKQGVFVYGVKWPGNAASAGLSRGDILLRVDDQSVESIEDVRRVHEQLVADVDSKHRAVLSVMRGGLVRQVVLDYRRDYSKE